MKDNQAKYPQLRFKGFTDPWEQRKVSELADRYDNLRVPITASERVAGETPYYGANGIQDYVESFTHNGEFVLVAEDGANDLQNYPVQYVDGKVWVNNHAHVLQAKEERVDNKFLTNALKHTNIEPYLVGGGRAKLNADVMMKINFKVPTLPEQVQIGKFFDNLDHLITLHQRKLAKLKELKQGYLQKLFPKNGSKFPQLRFAGFADAWEQRKLGEVAEFSKGNGYTKEDLTENGSPIILYGRLYTKYKAVINDVDTFVVPKDRSVISKGNEVIVPASGETAEDISRASVVGKSGFILGGDLNVIKPDILIDSLFLALTISNGSQQKEMAKRAQGKSVVHLHSSDLQQINLLYPKLKEQRKIGTFFKQLDDTITLHQRKLEKLQELKKGYLQKMFC
ncbi:restriction endonuclease subunit S [Lacticaseibacillus paracasei]|uniref:restriction endonuclease subunit S n=1 Tax=Lacticaseibacillus paracasei TaxID=1597 RepID=UPI0002974642|nr:restriction endonuclease subunit S [Lacticaseibacillus paracasei]EKQ17448.1 type I restriction-modification system, specificity subunit S [Lacticaseibacillus casei UW4]